MEAQLKESWLQDTPSSVVAIRRKPRRTFGVEVTYKKNKSVAEVDSVNGRFQGFRERAGISMRWTVETTNK